MDVRIGIVTPSYNQGQFLEETINSVLSQDYTPLQYVIIDGGSSDQSVEIIRKYEKYLHFWISEKDAGQSQAINKGLRQIRADVWAYLNSDDTYRPGTFGKVAAAFRDPNATWVTGRGAYVDVVGDRVDEMIPVIDWNIDAVLESLISSPVVMAVQVSNFMRSSIIDEFGYFDETLHYCMDVEYGLRPLLAGVRPLVIDEVLANARLHSQSKTVNQEASGAFAKESAEILERLISTGRLENHSQAASNALEGYRRQEAIGDVWRAWQHQGRMRAFIAWAKAVTERPSLVAHRPALGQLRRIITGWRG
jgi:glycosyltransferase involved in cell wall biosynthesis